MTPKAKLIPAAAFLQVLALAGAAGAEGNRPFAFSAMVGAGYAPIYEGSDNSEGIGLLDFNVSLADGRFFAGLRGIGYAPVLTDTLSLRLAIGYGGERKVADDPTNLAGLGNIDNEALGLLSAEFRMGQITLATDVTAGADYGMTAEFKVASEIVLSDRISLGGDLHATYADESHMQRYFGVTAAQSAASGLATYAAGTGVKSAGLGVTVSYSLTPSTGIALGAQYDRLMEDAAASPITRDEAQTSAFLGISTNF
jgi:outer membrane scaffolding protein for murein synthesis (MipA/OmpV family)